MYTVSFEPYLRLHKDRPFFDRGLGTLYWPTVGLFAVLSMLCLPLRLSRVARSVVHWFARDGTSNPGIEFVFSKNQMLVAKAINLSFTTKVSSHVVPPDGEWRRLNPKLLMVISILFSYEVLSALLEVRTHPRVRRNSLRVVKMVALRIIATELMKGKKVFVQYNDHSPYNVMLLSIAERLGLYTVYVQHAPVGNKFPSLRHDLNGLFSADSEEKYGNVSPNCTKIAMNITDIRFPRLEQLPTRRPSEVLICFNKLDDLDEVVRCSQAFVDRGYNVRLRPHPNDRRPLRIGKACIVSRGRTIWEDLSSAIVVIVNESAVALEAAYFSVNTFKLSTFSEHFDNYGFVKSGLLRRNHDNLEELINDFENGVWNCDMAMVDYFIGDINQREFAINQFTKQIKRICA